MNRFLTALLGSALLLPTIRAPLSAQGAQAAAGFDSLAVPPLTPGQAFLRSALLPGYSQSVLDRPTATVFFAGLEVVSVLMLKRSLEDLRQAKRLSRDSLVTRYRIDNATGLPVRDPDTGELIVDAYELNRFAEGLVNARRTHVEDWIAMLFFNHLFAGIDALVAAHLWELPGNPSVNVSRNRLTASLSIKW